MKVERWKMAEHLPLLEGWIRARGMGQNAGDISQLPPTGFVIDRIAAGFLHKTDSGRAFLGDIITDPASEPKHRGAALDVLLEMLRAEARDCGYTALAGTPSKASLIARFRAHGYTTVADCAYAIRRT
jgi:hypothetical protein